MISTILIDARNADEMIPVVCDLVAKSGIVGIDCETQDDNRHDGLNQYCGYNPKTRKKPAGKPLVFDWNRTVMTGFSVYPEGANSTYYINLAHADVENRVPWEQARRILDALPETSYWIAHNAAFEVTAFEACHQYRLERIICTMQMLVSWYGPDEYDIAKFNGATLRGIERLIPALQMASRGYQGGEDMSPELADLVHKILAKQSTAEHSYNGYVRSLAWGYGLKEAVKNHFGHVMTTYEEALRGKAHMGELTGEEVADYGGEDAFWAVKLFEYAKAKMLVQCPKALKAFFEQENPMIHTYANIWLNGMRVNTEAIYKKREQERERMAETLRQLKAAARTLLPFPQEPCKELIEAGEKWYVKSHDRYRQLIEQWLRSPDSPDAYSECQKVRGAVSNAWAAEKGEAQSNGVNLSHYMPMRTLLYDLLGAKIIKSDGKVQSDGEARGKIKTEFEKRLKTATGEEARRLEAGIKVIDCLNQIASIEQAMKLYLTPYTLLMDPETGRLYPHVSSELATRRMAASFPNPMQLAKRGETRYVRGFFLPDTDEDVIVSIDWSAIELVDIGEKSRDPEFLRAFGQLPHQDLHTGAAVSILQVEVPLIDEEKFKALKQVDSWEEWADWFDLDLRDFQRLRFNLKGEPLTPKMAASYWRTELGKGANFNYWYSGWLSTIGERMGWDAEKTKAATEKYRERFQVAEQWRLETIDKVQRDGFVELPDGHRRVRYEATHAWATIFRSKFIKGDAPEGYQNIVDYIIAKIQKRACNQAVNAMIQGTCAALAKRSQLRVDQKIREEGFRARFLMPIHDELLWSVHRSEVVEFIDMARKVMIDHPDLYQHCVLDASPAFGLTFEPWHAEMAPLGQVEVFEAPKLPVYGEDRVGKKMTADEIRAVVDYLFDLRKMKE